MSGPHHSAATPGDWMLCQEIARQHGRSFFYASRLLRGERRRSILAAYAYCRLADDIVDRTQGDRASTDAQLAQWERQLDEPRHPVAVAFAESRERFGIPERPVRELFDGMRADLTVNRYASWLELRRYCYQVAGTVGLIVAPILGCADPAALPKAAELGIAMQLTNILRDVAEDAAMGRVYLPEEELDAFGVDARLLQAGNPGPGFNDLMRFQIERARALYDSALTGVPALSPSGQITTLVAANVYAGILDQIESQSFQVFQRRAVVPRVAKARKTATAAVGFLQIASRGAFDSRRATASPPGPVGLYVERDVEGWRP